jgi:hypothetical protein
MDVRHRRGLAGELGFIIILPLPPKLWVESGA